VNGSDSCGNHSSYYIPYNKIIILQRAFAFILIASCLFVWFGLVWFGLGAFSGARYIGVRMNTLEFGG
jgi:hypothetical protein